jgi:antitoxin StbD
LSLSRPECRRKFTGEKPTRRQLSERGEARRTLQAGRANSATFVQKDLAVCFWRTRHLDSALKDARNGARLSAFKSNKGNIMAHLVLANTAASISELKRNPMGTVAAGEGLPVAILNRNEPAFYCIPAKTFEALMERLDDLELNVIADQRLSDGKPLVRVSPDEL